MYNKSQIMRRAWEIVRTSKNVAKFGLRRVLRNALIVAWREAKDALWVAPALTPARIALMALEAKDRWTPADYARADELRNAA